MQWQLKCCFWSLAFVKRKQNIQWKFNNENRRMVDQMLWYANKLIEIYFKIKINSPYLNVMYIVIKIWTKNNVAMLILFINLFRKVLSTIFDIYQEIALFFFFFVWNIFKVSSISLYSMNFKNVSKLLFMFFWQKKKQEKIGEILFVTLGNWKISNIIRFANCERLWNMYFLVWKTSSNEVIKNV